MATIWFASDHHFNHANILTFKGMDGKLIRPGFKNIEHMNEVLIENHNKLVQPSDKVYFGGDVGKNTFNILRRMNGKKRLIMGNHDDWLDKYSLGCFEKVLSWRFFGHLSKRFVISHYPLHPMSFIYRGQTRNEETDIMAGKMTTKDHAYNVHGHIHEKTVTHDDGSVDRRYLNICVEKINYTPLSMDEIQSRLG